MPKTENDKKNDRLYQTYGITLEEWTQLLSSQKGVCAVCKLLPGTGRLNVDHIHQKGFKKMLPEEKKKYVRGLCCFLCNTGFKGVERTADGKRNRQQLEGMVEYFKKYRLKGE